MCQEKPGPRCAAHTKDALDAARTRKAAADQAVRDAEHALDAARAAGGTLATTVAEHNTLAHARQDAQAARAAYAEALAEYQTTPAGQEDLRTAIRQLRAEGDTAAAARAEKALEVAIGARAQQVADLAVARTMKARLAAATPEEVAAMQAADARVAEAQAALDAAEQAAIDNAAAVEALRPEYDAAQAQYAAAKAAAAAADRIAETKAYAVLPEARRLYQTAGVNERMAGFYTQDMLDSAREKRLTERGAVVKALKIKVKRNGPDRDATLAAAEAAKTDPAFKARNQELSAAVAAARDARQNAAEMYHQEMGPVAERWTQTLRTSLNSKYAIEDAQAKVAAATADAHLLKAKIGAGMGVDGPPAINLRNARDEIVRNPDGTTNAYVYRAPSPGFPHGRMAAAVDISTVRGWSAANALVLEDGTTVAASEHYYRNTRGAQTARSDLRVYLTDPQDGATPLRAENHADAGFMSFIDSTD